jgi:hypothetical protein
MVEILSEGYKARTVNCECLRQIKKEVSNAVVTNKREYLVAPVAEMQLFLW